MKKVAIIGGETAGCAAAHQFGVQGDWEIHIFEGGNELGRGKNLSKRWSPIYLWSKTFSY